MSDDTPKEVQGIPQELADDIAALAADVSAMSRRAARAWKMTAVIWVILLCVITSYLYLLVYKPLKEFLTPENVLQMGVTMLNRAVQQAGGPASIEEPSQVSNWASGELKKVAPVLMRQHLKPFLDTQIARLPDLRKQWTDRFRDQGSVWINDAVQYFGDSVLPEGNKALLSLVDSKVDDLLTQFGGQVDTIVDQIVAEQKETWGQFKEGGANNAELRGKLEGAFEEAMGPVLDEVLKGLDEKVADAGKGIQDLVDKYKAKTLDHHETLEVRLIQLTAALFQGALEEAQNQPGTLDQLREALKKIGMPVAEQEAAVEHARESAPQGRAMSIDEMLQNVPEDRREEARKALEAEQEARQKAMAGQQE
jgi:hypothetical protein